MSSAGSPQSSLPRARGVRACAFLAAIAVLFVFAGCNSSSGAAWDDVTPSPAADPYDGPVLGPLEQRLDGRLSEGGLEEVGRRVEHLPAGTAWADHLEFRDAHAAGLNRVAERIPEPDAPVLIAEYQGGGRTLFVIAHSDESRERLVVLTALAE